MSREVDRATSKTVCKGNFYGYGPRIGERRQLGAGSGLSFIYWASRVRFRWTSGPTCMGFMRQLKIMSANPETINSLSAKDLNKVKILFKP